MRYTKPPIAIDNLIERLEKRGLKIEDPERAKKYLKLVGYYRLTGYMYHLQIDDGSHNFKEGVCFSDIINTYQFDKKLRYLFAEYIERIEVAMRAMLTDEYSVKHGFLWYTQKQHYDPPTQLDPDLKKQLEAEGKKIPRKYIDTHQYIMKCIKENFSNATEPFIAKFKRKYTAEQFPPSNMAMEILSMGNIAKLYEALKSCPEKDAVTKIFGVPNVILASWLIFLTNIRNVCAHHSRLWNRRITADQFAKPVKKSSKFNGELPDNFNTTVYGTLSVTLRLLDRINPDNNLLKKFKNLLAEYPQINIAYMGFPADWEKNPAWARGVDDDSK